MLQFGPLLIGTHRVAADGTGKAALRTQRELVDRCETRRLIDSPHDVIGVLEHGRLARNETERCNLPFREKTQRFETAGPRGVVLEEVSVDVDRVEEHLRYRVVGALSGP